MLELVLIRHGKTAWNERKIFRGRSDIPLSEVGIGEAKSLAESLRGEEADAVFCSPLLRAVQTAEPICKSMKVPLYKDDALVDVDFGYWSGLSSEEVIMRHPREWEMWTRGDLKLRFPGGESLEEVQKRLEEFLSSCVRNLTHRRLLVVTHRVPLKLILMSVLSAPSAFWQFVFDTTSISRIRHDGNLWSVVSLNDTHHLQTSRYQEDF
ncbi:MAG: histidine phosphatase family protein [Planctomycetota bacterium]|nr:histidine phosphatase family protein [Planctomycetota bacterium]